LIKIASEQGNTVKEKFFAAIKLLQEYDWTGILKLRNVVERLIILGRLEISRE
jgi:DNA-binding NtrC family response regulator